MPAPRGGDSAARPCHDRGVSVPSPALLLVLDRLKAVDSRALLKQVIKDLTARDVLRIEEGEPRRRVRHRDR